MLAYGVRIPSHMLHRRYHKLVSIFASMSSGNGTLQWWTIYRQSHILDRLNILSNDMDSSRDKDRAFAFLNLSWFGILPVAAYIRLYKFCHRFRILDRTNHHIQIGIYKLAFDYRRFDRPDLPDTLFRNMDLWRKNSIRGKHQIEA